MSAESGSTKSVIVNRKNCPKCGKPLSILRRMFQNEVEGFSCQECKLLFDLDGVKILSKLY